MPARASRGAGRAAAVLFAVLAPCAAAAGPYVLTAELPATLRKGAPATLLLHVQNGAQPVDHLVACLATAPLFISREDALDTTTATGIDLGVGPESGPRPACSMAIAGVPSGAGIYAFTWEPDTAGRVDLTFTVDAGAGVIIVPADVASAPPSPVVLAVFAVFVALVLSLANYVRHRSAKAAAP